MENVDYVAKAKILMKRTALTAALVVLPLAAVSSRVAQAATVLPTGNFNCSPTGAGASGGCPGGAGASQLADPGNGIQGVKLFTSGAVSYFVSGGGLSSLGLTTNGLLSGTINSGTVIPLGFDFSLAVLSGNVTSWDLTYTLIDNTFRGTALGAQSIDAQVILGTVFGTATFNGSGTGTFSGSGVSLTTTSTAFDADQVTVQAFLNVNWTGQQLDVTVPVNSFDVNAAAVPEPATFGLFGLGLALLGWRLVRDRLRESKPGFLLRR